MDHEAALAAKRIVFTMRVFASPGNAAEVVRALRSLRGPMEVKPGCVRCRLDAAVDDPRSLTWSEEWASQEQLAAHIRSDEFRTLLALMDMSTAPPEIQFDTVVRRVGIDLIEATRLPS